jgi:DNA-binding CsgD family transcriptional regulator
MGSLTAPVICPVFIGRASERATLHQLVDQTTSGQRHVAFLCGEAGIGKSRLIAEITTYAVANDFHVLQGNCFHTDRLLPYAPFLDLLSTHLTHYDTVTPIDDLEPLLSAWSHLLPDVLLHVPDLPPLPSAPSLDPEQDKRRCFTSLVHFLTRLAAQHPVLLILEDVHWCDDLSLEFLLYLARQASTHALFVVITYRSENLTPGLSHCLAELRRTRVAQELVLAGLSRVDVGAMLRALFALDAAGAQGLLDLLYPLTEGNPFFVEEVLTSLIASGALVCTAGSWQHIPQSSTHIPRSVQDAVRLRMEQVSPAARALLTLAAVAGRHFDVVILQQVLHCDEPQLLQLLREVIAAQLVVEESAERFAFRHALTRQAIYTSLLMRERRWLHQMLAETLEQRYAATPLLEHHLADLATHCHEAGMWERAMTYAHQAGERALTLYAPRVAIEHLTRAVKAAQQLQQPPPAQTYQARGQAYETLGNFDQARGDYEHALEVARASDQRAIEWRSMLALGFLWTGRDYQQAGTWFHRALALANTLAEPTLQARSLNHLGNWLMNTGQADEGFRAQHEALGIFQSLHDQQGIAQTLDLLAITSALSGDSVKAVALYGEAIEQLRAIGDHQGLASSLALRGLNSSPWPWGGEVAFLAPRERDACLRDLDEARQLAHQIDSLSGQAFAELVTAQVRFAFGEFGAALRHAREGQRLAQEIEHPEWVTGASFVLGQCYVVLLEPTRARQALEPGHERSQHLGSALMQGHIASYLALAYLLTDDLPQAAATLTAVLPRTQLPRTASERQIAWVWGELALAEGVPEQALQLAEHLLAATPGERRDLPTPHLLHLKGKALLACAHLEEAAQVLEAAKRDAHQCQAPSVLWRIHVSLGRVYQLLKRDDLAQRDYAAAQGIIAVLAGTIDEPQLREHFLQATLAAFPGNRRRTLRQTEANQHGGLTEREREVLRALAQGLTDAQIAAQLVISPRTVHSHLVSIYSKLGIASRSAATRYAIEHQLA